MPSDAFKLAACSQYLRRVYYRPVTADWDLAALRALATTAYAEASETVTITTTQSELGSGAGQITFDKWLLVSAVESLLAEIDPDNQPPAAPFGTVLDYSDRRMET